jgi:RimJ/RimL family protein N-acetyltransferase
MRAGLTNLNPLAPFSEVPPRIFETECLRLRALTLDDLTLIFETYTGDPVATTYMAWPRAITPEDGRPFLQGIAASFSGTPIASAQFSWAIYLKATGECIGGCGIGADSESVAGGGYILNPRFWGQGYAAKAFGAVVDWARGQPNVQRIVATHHPDNPASGSVMRKVGMSFDHVNHVEHGYPNLPQSAADEVVYAWVRAAGA